MWVCRPRPRPRHFAALSLCTSSPARSSSTPTSTTSPADASTSQSTDKSQNSIFTAPESPWDHVFSDIPASPPPPTSLRSRPRPRPTNDSAHAILASLSGRSKGDRDRDRNSHGHGHAQNESLLQRASGVRQQRASITAREMSVFNEMFDLIFNAVSARDGGGGGGGKSSGSTAGSGSGSSVSASTAPYDALLSGQMPSIGRSGAPLNDLFRTLRRHTSRARWTTAVDEELDRKKETMELFNTDYELLQWVTMELFGESRRWDEEAKKVITASDSGTVNKDVQGLRSTMMDSSMDTASATSSSLTSSSHTEHAINHSIYPHLIAHAMRIFRTTYSNPSLSLAIFNHAARVSIPSYVFGCTAPAYNELIEAKWEGWGDLEGVCNALEEMRANGVTIDGRTRIVVENVRREVGEARPEGLGEPVTGTERQDGLDGTRRVNPFAARVWAELGEAEVMKLLHQIERLALRNRSRKSTSSPHEESWKSEVLQPGEDDKWSFDGWGDEKKIGDTKKQRWKARPISQRTRMLDDWSASEEEVAFR